MDYSFKNIIIYSKAPEVLAHFLTSIFDLEVSKNEDSFFETSMGGVKFLIVENSNAQKLKHAPFEFEVSSKELFKDLQQKVEFFNYTQSMQLKCKIENENLLSLGDPDGRIWKFSLLQPLVDTQINPHKTNSYSKNQLM